MQRITGETQPRMPLGGAPLSERETAIIRSWIDQGARATPSSEAAKAKGESPLPLSSPDPVPQVWTSWTAPLDRFVAAYLSAQGVKEPQAASDAQFARRATLDIWGLLPEPDALRAFLNDRGPDKREKLVARLLSDETKYAEHWISFWNDLLRNDEGVTYHSENASRKTITDWLLASLKSNLPYDQFVSKLLNPTTPSDPEGFLIGVNWRGTVSASQTPAMQAAQNTAQIFLGLNLKCNACHDSFISKWKLKQAYAMASYFSVEPKLQLFRCDIAQQEFAEPAFLFPELNRAPASNSLADRRATAAAIFTDPRNGRMPRTLVNRIWQRLVGHGLVNDPDEMDGEPWNAAVLDFLASDFVEHRYDLKYLIATIVNSRTYQMPAVKSSGAQPGRYAFRGPEVRRITAEQFADAIGAITGEWHTYQPISAARPNVAAPAATVATAGAVASSPVRNLSGAAHGGVGDPGTPGVEAARAKALAAGAPDPALVPKAPIPTAAMEVRRPEPSRFTREWRVAASPLARALGRPIRDQVYSVRDAQATTLQALEVVNGEALTHWLGRGARKMLGELPPEPVSIFDARIQYRNTSAPLDVDVSGATKLWLLVQDIGSYSPEKVLAVWSDLELVGPSGVTPLSSLKPTDDSGLRPMPEGSSGSGVRVKTPSRVVYDLGTGSYTRLRGTVGLENKVVTSEINPQIRFFVFRDEPNMERLTPVAATTPLPPGPTLKSAAEIVDRVFWYALGRAPSAGERNYAEGAITDAARPGRVSADGLADLLWAVFAKPEFQLIY